MPLSVNDVALKINPIINDQFIGLKKTFASLQTVTDQTQFLTLCLQLVAGKSTFQFSNCSSNTDIKDYFSHIAGCFIDSKEKLFEQNEHIKTSDQPVISLFSRIAILKSLYELFIERQIQFPIPLLDQMIICIQEVNRNFELLPREIQNQITFLGKTVNSRDDLNQFMELELQRAENYPISKFMANGLIFAGSSFTLTATSKLSREAVLALVFFSMVSFLYLSYSIFQMGYTLFAFSSYNHAERKLKHRVENPAAGNQIIIDHFIIPKEAVAKLISERENQTEVNRDEISAHRHAA